MPRPKSPCGTYPAYQRHLREKTPVDAACREAQQERDGGRGRVVRERAAAHPQPALAASSVQRRDALQARYLERLVPLSEAARVGNIYEVIDIAHELDGVLDEWCDAQDDVDYESGYPLHSEAMRAQLLAAR